MATSTRIPHIITGALTVLHNTAITYIYYPVPIEVGGTTVTPPTVVGNWTKSGTTGWVTGFEGRVGGSPSLTLGPTRVSLYRDIRTFPNGGQDATAAQTALLKANARPERLLYESAYVVPTPSDTVLEWDDRSFTPQPFHFGFWIAIETDTAAQSGGSEDTADIQYRIYLDLLGD